MPHSEPALPSTPPSLTALFGVCFKIGVLSFGGGLSGWLYQEFVLRKRWIDEDTFSSSLAISQMLPGANVVNLVICIGEQLCGPRGAIVGVAGFLLGPFFAVIGIYQLFELLAGYPLLPVISDGIAFAAIGLLLLMCVHGVKRATRFPPSIAIIAATALLAGVLEWPLIPVALVMAPVSVAMAWRRS